MKSFQSLKMWNLKQKLCTVKVLQKVLKFCPAKNCDCLKWSNGIAINVVILQPSWRHLSFWKLTQVDQLVQYKWYI